MTKSPSETHPTVEWKQGEDSLGVYFLQVNEIFHFKFTNDPVQRQTVMYYNDESFVLKGNFTIEYRNFIEAGFKRGLTIEEIFEECKYFYDKNPAFQTE